MGEFSVWHWLIVAVVFVLLFGARKLPEAARGLGRSLRIFRAEIRADETGARPAGANPGAEPGIGPVDAAPDPTSRPSDTSGPSAADGR
jgi:sec-independent protein translocase protein TatA